METSSDGLYVKHDDTKVDKTTYDIAIGDINDEIDLSKDRIDTLETKKVD